MERIGEFRRPIRSCEIDGHDHAQFCASSEIVHKGRFLENLISFQYNYSCFFAFGVVEHIGSSVSNLSNLDSDLANKLIVSVFLPVPHLNSETLLFGVDQSAQLYFEGLPSWVKVVFDPF